jgi:hypothetical protein
VARSITIYGLGIFYNLTFGRKKEKIPFSWMHVFNWGGIRGALPIALVLFLPEVQTIPALQERSHDLVIIVSGVVLLSLLINGSTIKFLISLLKLDSPSQKQKIETELMQTFVLSKALKRVKHLERIGDISGNHTLINKKFIKQFKQTIATLCSFENEGQNTGIIKRSLFTFAFNLERDYFIKLQEKEIISARILKRLEQKIVEGIDLIQDGVAPLEFAQNPIMKKISKNSKKDLSLQEIYLYRKARELANLEVMEHFETFRNIPALNLYIKDVLETYSFFYEKNKRVCKDLEERFSKQVKKFEEVLCSSEFIATEVTILEQLEAEGKISTNTMRELRSKLAMT